jgi:hypothetical protein
MSDVFDEISDDLRREKLNQFWRENGRWIIGGVIAAIIFTAGMSWWRQWDANRNAQATSSLGEALAAKDPAELEQFAQGTDHDHAAIARLIAAGDYVRTGKKDKAVTLYNEIAASSGLSKMYRSLASLLSVGLRLDTDPVDGLRKELKPLAADRSAWRYSAREMQALLAAREGDMKGAVGILDTITGDADAPEALRARAFTLREFYAAEQSGNK